MAEGRGTCRSVASGSSINFHIIEKAYAGLINIIIIIIIIIGIIIIIIKYNFLNANVFYLNLNVNNFNVYVHIYNKDCKMKQCVNKLMKYLKRKLHVRTTCL